MVNFFKKTIFTITLLLPAFAPAATSDIITAAPEGKTVEYFADFDNFDNVFGFMGDYHSVQKIIFTDDDKVYFPNLLLRRTMNAYVVGTYNRADEIITIEPGQLVFLFPNVKIPVGLYTLDSEGNAGPTATTFYDNPLVFDVSDDGTLTLRSSVEFPMFGLCNANASNEVYQNAMNLRFIPVDHVKDVARYNYNYVYGNETSATSTTAQSYRESDQVMWIKGFVPKYPDRWVKVEHANGVYKAASFQVMDYFSTEDPIVFAATDGTDLLYYLPMSVDEATGTITAGFDDVTVCTATPDGNGSFEPLIIYSRMSLTPADFASSKPAAPSFVSYSKMSSGEVEFIFSALPLDTEGNQLMSDCVYFRMFVDGKPYTFTPAGYQWITEEKHLVDYNFNDYNFFSKGGPNNERRYVYFQDLTAATKTVGVEVVYVLDGVESVSDRLTYDIASGKAELSGITAIADDTLAGEAVYYDLQGMRVDHPVKGRLYIRVSGGRASKVLAL